MLCGKNHSIPEAKLKEKITKGQKNDYTIKINSKLYLRAQ
jgi:hypothetical protein